MTITMIQLLCEGEDCNAVFPEEGPVDGAIFNVSELRGAAMSEKGWGRRGGQRDLCAACWVKLRAALAAGKVKK